VQNVEGATIDGIPLIVIGFTATMAWSQTDSQALTITPYQLTLVPGHPTEYVVGGRPVKMTSRTVTISERAPGGTLKTVRRTLWSTRYGPIIDAYQRTPLPWTTQSAFALADVNAGNFRFLNSFLATDQARSVAAELTILRTYQGNPWTNTLVADSTGHAAYADIQAIPDVTNAEAARCDTALGKVSFAHGGPPVLDGSRPSCAWGTDKDSAAAGIFGPAEEPVLTRRDFVENSNDSYWMTNPAHPLTGFPRMIGLAGTGIPGAAAGADLGLRTRSALAMVTGRIRGTDGLGPPRFTFADMKHLMYSDIQYGATLVKSQLVTMCRSFPNGQAPTGPGHTIPVGDSCRVLAAWNGRENPASRGAVLFRAFWDNVFNLPSGPWSHPFTKSDPVHTPYGLDTASTAVQTAFGAALQTLKAAHLPYNVPLAAVQYVTLNGTHIPLPGGPGDPQGEFNVIYQGPPGSVPFGGSSYIQVISWKTDDPCPQAATVLTYSESANPASPHYADQTKLFSRRGWVTPYFCPDQIAAHAVSTDTVRTR
jgi:acyl-homoserine-lactone acylase